MLAYYGPEWESLANRMVGRWCPSFSGNTGLQLPDTMGRNHGTLINFSNNGNDAYVASPDKLAVDCDGSNDFVVATTPLLSGSLSFSVWARGVTGNASTNYIASIPIASSGSNGIDFRNPTNAQANLALIGTFVTINSGVDIRGSWNHLLMGYGNGVAFFYVNGILVGSQAWANGLSPLSSRELNLGRFGSFGSHSPVQLDDIIIFNTGLTANDVRFIYEQGRGGGMLMQPPRRRSVAAVIAALVLACETGNYSLTGQEAGLFASRVLAADQAQYILSGNAANTTASRLLSVDPASYTATGNDAATICARLLDGGAAAYALTGTDAGLIANRKLTADQAVYFLAGNNAELLRSLKLNAGSWALQLDNFAASLLANRKISADGAQYILVVSDANLTGSASGVAPYYYLFMMRGPQ